MKVNFPKILVYASLLAISIFSTINSIAQATERYPRNEKSDKDEKQNNKDKKGKDKEKKDKDEYKKDKDRYEENKDKKDRDDYTENNEYKKRIEVGARERQLPLNSLNIPKGHLPPPGECKIWIPGKPAGQQGPNVSCAYANANAPLGAWVITHEGERYRVNIFNRRKRSVIDEIRYYQNR